MAIVPSLHGLACLQDAAWSPNAQQVAALGYSDQCPNDDPSSYNYQSGVLQIYSAATGQLVHTLLPDATVLGLPGIPSPPSSIQPASANADTSKPVLDYTHVLWSPDGNQLALTFVILRWNTAGTITTPAFAGLVLVNADGTNERAALLNETSQQYSALRWDTTTLGWNVIAVQRGFGDFVSMPLGTSYSWTSGGRLMPSGMLTSPSSPTSPVGNPDGGNAFTIWQPSILQLFPEPGSPYIYTSYTAFLAWSPDGRYLIDSVSLRGIVHPVGEPAPAPGELNLLLGQQNAPTMLIRDPAQQDLYVALTASSNSTDGASADDIAWSPNGRVLAGMPDIVSSIETSGSSDSAPVTLYNSSTGKAVRTLQPQSFSRISANSNAGSNSLLRWSADGSHLLVYSDQLGTITIWGPSSLRDV